MFTKYFLARAKTGAKYYAVGLLPLYYAARQSKATNVVNKGCGVTLLFVGRA